MKSKIHFLSTITIILLLSVCAILTTFLIINVVFGVEFTDGTDIFNWVGLVVEIGLASGITLVVWYYTRNEQNKTSTLISDIKNLTDKIDKIVTKDQENKKERENTAINNLSAYLTKLGTELQLIMSYWENPLEHGFWFEDAKKVVVKKGESIKQLEQILELSVGAIDQYVIHETREILNTAKDCVYFVSNNQKKMDPKECKFLIERIDNLMSRLKTKNTSD